MLVADARTRVGLALSPGQAGDAPWGRAVLGRVGPPPGHPARLMDRADQDPATRRLAGAVGDQPVVPPAAPRKEPWDSDRVLDRRRNEVERFFCRLRRSRRIATRYDKLDRVFLAFIYLALIYDALQLT